MSELLLPNRYPYTEQQDTERQWRLVQLAQTAHSACLKGHDTVTEPIEHIEDVANPLKTFLSGTQCAADYVERWNDLEGYIHRLDQDSDYNMLPELLERAQDFTSHIVEPEQPVDDEGYDEDIEAVDACVAYFAAISGTVMEGDIIFDDDGSIYYGGGHKIPEYDQRIGIEVDPSMVQLFDEFWQRLQKARINGDEVFVLTPGEISDILQPLHELSSTYGNLQEIERQIIDLEFTIYQHENYLALQIDTLRDAAALLRRLVSRPGLAKAYGLEVIDLVLWLNTVGQLQLPHEKRKTEKIELQLF